MEYPTSETLDEDYQVVLKFLKMLAFSKSDTLEEIQAIHREYRHVKKYANESRRGLPSSEDVITSFRKAPFFSTITDEDFI